MSDEVRKKKRDRSETFVTEWFTPDMHDTLDALAARHEVEVCIIVRDLPYEFDEFSTIRVIPIKWADKLHEEKCTHCGHAAKEREKNKN